MSSQGADCDCSVTTCGCPWGIHRAVSLCVRGKDMCSVFQCDTGVWVCESDIDLGSVHCADRDLEVHGGDGNCGGPNRDLPGPVQVPKESLK